MGGFGYPFPTVPDDGKNRSPFRSAQDVLTSPNDLDLGMLEALGQTGGSTPWMPPAARAAQWQNQIGNLDDYQPPSPTPVAPPTPVGWQGVRRDQGPRDFTSGAGSPYNEAPVFTGPDTNYAGMSNDNPMGWIQQSTIDTQKLVDNYNAIENEVRSADGYVSMEDAYNEAMTGTGNDAITYFEEMMASGQSATAEDFRIAYREENGIDPARMAVVQDASGVADVRRGDYYDQLDPAAQDRYDQFAALQPNSSTTVLTKDFQAVEAFLKTLPSEEERKEADKAAVTQADADAYLKELDAMSDEDYNALVDDMGLGAAHHKVDGRKPWEIDSGVDVSTLDPSADPFSTFTIDNEAILEAVATWKSTQTGDEEVTVETDEETGDTNIDEEITTIFGDLTTPHQEDEIRRRMAELGTTDLTQLIRDEFATITTPDYAADILTAHESMRTAVSDAAQERSDQLEAATTRAEGRISEIKSTLTGELQAFEIDRVEQQRTLNQKVIDRTTDMELALTERLADIRTELGDQVTDEFESVAALAGTLTSSQATSSRDAMSRLGQIADMAAAARLAAPAELSAEALTSLGDLEFQIENQIAQAKADTTAQINIEQASAILNETMRQGGFETEKQRALVEATLGEALRGTVYEDRVQEMMTEALLQEDQYVRQFNENVDRSEAQAKLQNLFGTQEYERQLDMMNLQRDWQTADALQTRGWQTDDMTTTRGWQNADYAKALADQKAAALLERGYQTDDYAKALADQRDDYDTALLDQRYDTEMQRQADVADALAENAVGDDPLSQMKAVFPGVSDELYTTAMAIAKMPDVRESTTKWQDKPPDDADFDGTVEQIGDRYFVTEYGGLSDAEAYLRRLGEGEVIGTSRTGAETRTPSLSAEDYASLRALVDMARRLIALRNQAQYDDSGAQYGWAWGTQDPTAAMDAVLAR